MTRISAVNELNPFDHLYTMNSIESKLRRNLIKLINNKTAKLVFKSNESRFIIIHRYTKEINSNKFQLSFFDAKGAYSDIVRDSIKDLLKEISLHEYNILEVA